jgi:hypothetical protein
VTLSDDAKTVNVKPFDRGPSWRVGDSKSFAEQIRSELLKESVCHGLELETAVVVEDHLHLCHGSVPVSVDLPRVAQVSAVFLRFYEQVTELLASDVFHQHWAQGRRASPSDSHFDLLSKQQGEFQGEVFRGMAFFLVAAKAAEEASAERPNLIFGKCLSSLLHVKDGQQTMYMKRLLGDNTEFKKFSEIAKALADTGCTDFTIVPFPYQPFVKRFVQERRQARETGRKRK